VLEKLIHNKVRTVESDRLESVEKLKKCDIINNDVEEEVLRYEGKSR